MLTLLCAASLFCEINSSISPLTPNEPTTRVINVNNRPLAKINGETISTYDVQKKMEIFLFEQTGGKNLSVEEKFQFFSSQWKTTLENIIEDHIILIDAEAKELKVGEGEIRENIQNRFGPNVIKNIHALNLDYDEVKEMARKDLIIQKLVGMWVYSKAFLEITPKIIKNAYKLYIEDQSKLDKIKYQVISIQSNSSELRESTAKKVQSLLSSAKASVDNISEVIADTDAKISISKEYTIEEHKLSNSHKEILGTMSSNSFSAPQTTFSRSNSKPITRIFHLKDKLSNEPKNFEMMHDQLKNELMKIAVEKERTQYIKGLKKRHGFDKYNPEVKLPDNFKPFFLY